MGNFVGDSRADDMAADLEELTGTEAPSTSDDAPPVTAGEEESAPAETPPPQTITIGGIEYPAEMAQDINQLVQWASSLTPEQYDRMNRALIEEETAPTPAPEPEPEPEIEYDDPQLESLAKRQKELEAELEAERERVAQIESSTEQRTMEQFRSEFESAQEMVKAEVMDAYGFDEAEWQQLVGTATKLNIVQGMIREHGLEDGLRQTMQTALYADENLRSTLIQSQAESTVQQRLNDERKQAASALSPQGGTNIPSQNPANLPISEKRQAMVADLNEMLGNT